MDTPQSAPSWACLFGAAAMDRTHWDHRATATQEDLIAIGEIAAGESSHCGGSRVADPYYFNGGVWLAGAGGEGEKAEDQNPRLRGHTP